MTRTTTRPKTRRQSEDETVQRFLRQVERTLAAADALRRERDELCRVATKRVSQTTENRQEAKTATDAVAQLTWEQIVATQPSLAELEQRVVTMRVATTMPHYGRDWLEIDDGIYEITGRGPAYQIARDHLHRLYADRAQEASATEVDEA